MPNNVDTRIVEMEFDNAQFERGAKQTLKTLDALHDSLNFDNVSKSFSSISNAASRVDLTPITDALQNVHTSMSAFESFSLGIFEKLGHKVADLGTNMANELFIAQKKAGFSEYEMELGSVQTINASTGKSFEEIYGYLAELNKYADETIYSFSDMTKNIGKFTNAGVELETAVKAIQGISNEAAVSGANAEEASRAMYNFAQALSAGSVKLIDWKSIENANMATVEFKEELMKTALELGTIVKDGDKFVSTTTNMQGSVSDAFTSTTGFNDSLAHQWMTTEVLTKTLARYSDATTDLGKKAFSAAQDVKSFTQLIDTLKEAIGSGWSETFRIVIGEFEDAKKLWTGVSNVLGSLIDRFSNFRNHMLRYWKQEGGRTRLLNSMIRLWKIFSERIKIVSNLFNEYFPILNKTGHVLMNFTNRFADFTKQLKKDMLGNSESLEKFKTRAVSFVESVSNVISILSSIGKAALTIVKTVLSAIFDQFDNSDAIGWLSVFTGNVKESVDTFAEWITEADKHESVYNLTKSFIEVVGNTILALGDLASIIKGILAEAGGAFNEVFGVATGKTFVNFSKSVRAFTKSLADGFRKSQNGAKGFRSLFKVLFKVIKLGLTIVKALINGLSAVFNVTSKKGTPAFIKFFDALGDILDRFIKFLTESHLIEKAILGIAAVFKGINDFVKGLTGKSIIEHLLSVFDFFIKMENKVDLKALGKRIGNTIDTIVDKLQYLWTNVLHLGDENTGPAQLVDNVNTLKDKIDEAGGGVEGFAKVVKEKFGEIYDTVDEKVHGVIDFLNELYNTCVLIADSLKTVLGKIGNTTAEGIVTLVSSVVDEKTLKKIEESETFIGDAWIKLKEIAEVNAKGLDGKGNGKTLSMENLNDRLKDLYDGLKKSVWLIDLITDTILKLQIGKAALDFAQGVKNIGAGMNTMAIGFKNIADSTGIAFKRFMKYKQLEALGSFLLSLSVAFLALFAIIIGLTSLFTFGSKKVISTFYKVCIAMGVAIALFATAIVIMLWQLNKASQKNTNFVEVMKSFSHVLYSLAAVFVGFGVAIAILAGVYSKIGGKKFLIIIGALGAFVIGIFALMLWVIRATSKDDNIKYGVFNIAETFTQLAKMILAIGAAMVLMAVALQIIARVPKDGFWRAGAVLLAFYAMLLVLIETLIKTPSEASARILEGLEKVILSVGKAMVLLAIALGTMTKVADSTEPSTFLMVTAILGLFMVIMGAMVVLASKYANSSSVAAMDRIGDMVSKLSGAMLALATSIAIIGYVMTILKKAKIDAKYFWMIFGIIAVLGVVLAGLAALTNAVPGGAVTYILIATAFVILASAIWVLGKSLKTLENVDFDILAKGFKTLGKSAGWMAAVAGGMLLLGVGSLALAVGLLALWLPLALIWPIFQEIIDEWPKIQAIFDGAADSTTKLDKSVSNVSLGTSIGDKIGKGLRDLVKAIKKYAPEIIDDISDIMSLVVQGFFAPLSGVGKGLITVLSTSLSYINEHINEVLEPLGQLIIKINTWLKLFAPLLAETVAMILFYIFNGAFVVLANYAGILAENMYEAFARLLEAFGDQLTSEKNERIAKAVARISDGLIDLIKQTFIELSHGEFAEAGANLVDAIVEGIKSAPNKIKKAINNALGWDMFTVHEGIRDPEADHEWYEYWDGDQWMTDLDKYETYLKARGLADEAAAEAADEARKKSLETTDWDAMTYHPNAEVDQAELEKNKKAAREKGEKTGEAVGEGTKEGLLDGINEKLSGTGTSISDIIAAHMQGMKSEDIISSFGLEGIINIDDLSEMFSVGDMSSMMPEGVSFEVPLELGDADTSSLQDQLSEYGDMDFSMGDTSTDIAQTTSGQVNADLNDETKDLLKSVKTTLADLTSMLDNVTIVSNDSKLSTTLDVDGETLGSAVMPFVDAAFAGGGRKAKTKTAQGYKKRK